MAVAGESNLQDSDDDGFARQRKAIAGLARIKGLPDGVFSIVTHNLVRLTGWPDAPGPHAIDPYSVFPDEPREVVEMWVQRSHKLLNANFPVGNALVGRHPDYARLKGQLAADHPGFSQESYDRAVYLGAAGAR